MWMYSDMYIYIYTYDITSMYVYIYSIHCIYVDMADIYLYTFINHITPGFRNPPDQL